MRWADVEPLVVQHLAAATGIRWTTRTPAALEDLVPLGRVRRGPGTDDGVTDSPLIDVEVFTAADDEDNLWTLTEAAREAMHALRGRVVGGRLVDSVRTATAPTDVDYENTKVRRTVASYRLDQRKTP